jgi:hypothetical protein
MTSSVAAAAQLAKALSSSEQQLSKLKENADICGIPQNVVNKLTRLDLPMTNMFKRTKELLDEFLQTISQIKTQTNEQKICYQELMKLKNTIDLYESCKQDSAKMLQWVRGFSALRIVSQAMSENGIKSRVFGGHEGFFHFGRSAWSGDANKYGNVLESMNQKIQKIAKSADVSKPINQEVEDLLFEARLDNLREDPLKLTGIDRLVQAFADDAASKILANFPPAGKKQCPGA